MKKLSCIFLAFIICFISSIFVFIDSKNYSAFIVKPKKDIPVTEIAEETYIIEEIQNSDSNANDLNAEPPTVKLDINDSNTTKEPIEPEVTEQEPQAEPIKPIIDEPKNQEPYKKPQKSKKSKILKIILYTLLAIGIVTSIILIPLLVKRRADNKARNQYKSRKVFPLLVNGEEFQCNDKELPKDTSPKYKDVINTHHKRSILLNRDNQDMAEYYENYCDFKQRATNECNFLIQDINKKLFKDVPKLSKLIYIKPNGLSFANSSHIIQLDNLLYDLESFDDRISNNIVLSAAQMFSINALNNNIKKTSNDISSYECYYTTSNSFSNFFF